MSPWVKVTMTLTTKEDLTTDQTTTTTMLIAQTAILAIAMTLGSDKGETNPTMRTEMTVTTRVTPQLASREQMKS